MGNIFNHNRPVFKLKTSKSDYWDMHLYESQGGDAIDDGLQEDCLSVYIDTTKDECVGENELVSSPEYTWEEAVNNGIELNNIGLTGIDNGLITYDKDKITDEEFMEIYTNSKLVIDAEDMRLHLNKVGGNNKIYRYDNEMVDEDNMRVAKLDGGFFQGFFKTGNGCNYNILPSDLGDGICFEFTLKPEPFKTDYHTKKEKYSVIDYNSDGWDGDSDIKKSYFNSDYNSDGYLNDFPLPTINDVYPDNVGTFFYMGTRAENKWWKYYTDSKDNTDIETASGVSLNEQIELLTTNNKFITYNRTEKGYKATMGHFDDPEVIEMQKNLYTDNYFIIMNRAKGGYTARTIKELQQESNADYNILGDLYNNAISFQIKPDGSVGYKYMVKDCTNENGYSIENEWSYPEMAKYDEWVTIDVRLIPIVKFGITDFGYIKSNDYMRILIYVNGKLVLYSKQLPMIDLRALNDVYEKQEGVPYNISLGGGTQGLCDVVYENYKDVPEYVLFLEKEFGGSFTGYLKSFKFYTCDQNFTKILANSHFEHSLILKK